MQCDLREQLDSKDFGGDVYLHSPFHAQEFVDAFLVSKSKAR